MFIAFVILLAGSTTGPNYYVRVLSTIDRELLKPNSSVALHKHSNALVDVLPPEADSSIAMLAAEEKPDVSYADIGRLMNVRWTFLLQHIVTFRWYGHSKTRNA